MSKSMGNSIDPREVYSRSGADILRLWTASSDYSNDVPVSEEILSRVTESYRRMRNTLRFLLGNCFDYDRDSDAVPTGEMEEIDRWMLSKLEGLVKKVTSLMDRWLVHQAIQALALFCTVELSSLYLDILKDRLYTYPADSRGRRSAQTAIFEINSKLTAMMAPVLAHTAEEAMLALPEGSRPAESIHMALWPTYDESRVDEALEVKWDRLLEVREDVYRKIEESRKQGLLGTSLEAKAVIYAAGETMGLLRGMEEQLPAVLITSAVEIRDLDSFAGVRELTGDVEVEVQRAQGGKCQRCWNYSSSVSADSEEPGVCDRCEAALGSMGR